MININDDDFQKLIDNALAELPKDHVDNIKNVAIIYSDFPSQDQIEKLNLRHDQTLLGLYEGVPLTQRQGMTRIFPDKITLFKYPLLSQSFSFNNLKENIKHTLWHEIAHYYGLNHSQIKDLES